MADWPRKHTVSLEAAVRRIETLENHIDALLDADTEGEINLPDYIRSELVDLHNDGDDVPKGD